MKQAEKLPDNIEALIDTLPDFVRQKVRSRVKETMRSGIDLTEVKTLQGIRCLVESGALNLDFSAENIAGIQSKLKDKELVERVISLLQDLLRRKCILPGGSTKEAMTVIGILENSLKAEIPDEKRLREQVCPGVDGEELYRVLCHWFNTTETMKPI